MRSVFLEKCLLSLGFPILPETPNFYLLGIFKEDWSHVNGTKKEQQCVQLLGKSFEPILNQLNRFSQGMLKQSLL